MVGATRLYTPKADSKKKKKRRGEKFKRCSPAHLLCRYQRACFWKVAEIVRRGVERCAGEGACEDVHL